MYFKAVTSMLSPYPTEGVIEFGDLDNEKVNKIVSEFDLTKLEEINSIDALVNELVSFFEERLINPEIFKNLLSYLAVTFKGIKLEEIEKLTGIDYEEWKLVLCFFKSFFFTHRGLWKIRNQVLSKVIKERYVNSQEKAREIHLNIANVIEDEVFTLRILEEKTNHYYIAREFNLLKQTIVSIDAFLLLFNPHTKYDLCRYWQLLETQGYDPVVEYNKGIEIFDMHFSPKPEDLFTIILQISRFLKEFSDFETLTTPEFKHPFIQGKTVDRNTDKAYLKKEGAT